MKILALSSLYRQSFSVILGIAGLLVLLGVEVCVPTCTESGVRARSCETVQVFLMEGMAWCGDQGVWQLRGVATFARLRMTHRDYWENADALRRGRQLQGGDLESWRPWGPTAMRALSRIRHPCITRGASRARGRSGCYCATAPTLTPAMSGVAQPCITTAGPA